MNFEKVKIKKEKYYGKRRRKRIKKVRNSIGKRRIKKDRHPKRHAFLSSNIVSTRDTTLAGLHCIDMQKR